MAVRRRNGRWVVDFYFHHPDGRTERIRRASPVNTRRGAQDYERQLRAAMLEGRRSAGEIPRIEEFGPRWVEDYAVANRQAPSSVRSKEVILRTHIYPVMGSKRLDEIGPEDVQRLKRKLANHAPKTVNNVLSVLGAMLRTAVDWRIIGSLPTPITMVRVPRRTMDFYDDAELERLLEAAEKLGSHYLLILLLGAEAGLRAGEIIGLEWPDIDFTRGHLVVRRTVWRGKAGPPKSGRERIIPLTSRLSTALQAERHLRGPRVLYRPDGTPYTLPALARRMETIQRRAGLEPTGKIHILRHTFCSRLAIRGAPAKAIQELAGHVSLSTTQRYMHLSPAAREGAIRLLEGAAPGWSQDGRNREDRARSTRES